MGPTGDAIAVPSPNTVGEDLVETWVSPMTTTMITSWDDVPNNQTFSWAVVDTSQTPDWGLVLV
jgi:hypothetical protein